MYSKPDLRINLIPIAFKEVKFTGSELPYEDQDRLKELRDTCRESHVIKRRGNKIQCVPLTDESELLGTEKQFSCQSAFKIDPVSASKIDPPPGQKTQLVNIRQAEEFF